LWQEVYCELEDLRDSVVEIFDPHKTFDEPDRDFLSWLAHWVALDPDDEIFVGPYGGQVRQRLRRSIERAADLYAHRGTIDGLHDLIGVFLGEGVSIEEWTWPSGLTIGLSSSIGVDTFLTDQPDLGACFTVIWRTPVAVSEDSEADLCWLQMPLAVDRHDRTVFSVVASGPAVAATLPWYLQVRRLRRLLDLEKPAHADCFVALDTAGPTGVDVSAADVMIIGVTSTIGMCWIECAT
jgi:phage tail-like protein